MYVFDFEAKEKRRAKLFIFAKIGGCHRRIAPLSLFLKFLQKHASRAKTGFFFKSPGILSTVHNIERGAQVGKQQNHPENFCKVDHHSSKTQMHF